MDLLGFIPDGWTDSGTIAAWPRLYPAVKITWRPMLTTEIAEHFDRAAELKAPQARQLIAATLTNRLKSWDLKDEKGQVLPIKADVLLKVKDQLFQRLWLVVMGREPPDEREGATPAEQQDELADVLKAAETGRSVEDVRQERQRGN